MGSLIWKILQPQNGLVNDESLVMKKKNDESLFVCAWMFFFPMHKQWFCLIYVCGLLSVRLDKSLEKWKNRKWFGRWKSGKIENILISFFLLGWEWKSEKMKKLNLYKFIHISLLKKWSSIKIKNWQITKKYNCPNLLKYKNHVHKKSKQTLSHSYPPQQKKKGGGNAQWKAKEKKCITKPYGLCSPTWDLIYIHLNVPTKCLSNWLLQSISLMTLVSF